MAHPHPRRDIIRRRHPLRAALAVATAALVAAVAVFGFALNENIEWSVVADYLFDPNILRGLWVTIEITFVGMAVSLVGALLIALMRMSPSRVIRWIASAYIFTFRGIPIILLLILVGNLGLFVKTVRIGIPFTDVDLFSRPSSELLTPFVASIIGLSLAGSAYMSEIFRSGLLSIGRGQRDAAKALGLTARQTTRFVVLPPALRVIVPPLGNEFISLLKATAIVAVIGGGDLLTVAQSISGVTYRTIEMLLVAAWWYFVVVAGFTLLQHVLEQRIAER
ncbi:MAG: amino acid ABC transporter permease [Gaiellales bacterium]